MPPGPIIMNPNPTILNVDHINPLTSPYQGIVPDMKPAGSFNIPKFEDTPMGRGFEETRKEEKYHIRNPTYEPIKFEPIKIEMPKIEKPYKETFKYTPPRYEPPIKEFELFPKKHFWDKI